MLKATNEILQRRGLMGPTLMLDRERAVANIRRMAAKAHEAGTVFRPHFKTHQSDAVASWFRDEGVTRITVSSLDMAEQFVEAGWNDITVAVLHNPRRTSQAAQLAQVLESHGGQLGLLVDDARVAAELAEQISVPCRLWLKIDTGYGRTGIRWDDEARLREVLAACQAPVLAVGLLTHSGHSYHVQGAAAVQALYAESITRLKAAQAACGRKGLQLSFGDTPCCSLVDDLSACDEIRPGNFVFHDLMQLAIGSCRARDLAAAVVCPVIGVYPERRQVVIHGGAVHLSKESLPGAAGHPIYGCLGTVTEHGFGEVLAQAPLVSLSQEHGVVEVAAAEFPSDIAPGDLVLVWPVHSCLCCDLLDRQMVAPVLI
jgi:D-serine deaminase-like pyridoxal phosphate-dependent protein